MVCLRRRWNRPRSVATEILDYGIDSSIKIVASDQRFLRVLRPGSATHRKRDHLSFERRRGDSELLHVAASPCYVVERAVIFGDLQPVNELAKAPTESVELRTGATQEILLRRKNWHLGLLSICVVKKLDRGRCGVQNVRNKARWHGGHVRPLPMRARLVSDRWHAAL
jgi:hypothetical protein